MRYYKVDEQTVNNILTFLGRAEFKGWSDFNALQDILKAFSNPIEDNQVAEQSQT